jgi:hypothetical protein
MAELRVYVNPPGASLAGGHGVFYSRRAHGPFYRWHYEEAAGSWCASRVRLSVLTLRALNTANWQNVPTTLQAMLDKHYLD